MPKLFRQFTLPPFLPRYCVIAALVLPGLAGCGLPRSGPVQSSILDVASDDTQPYDLIPLTPSSITPYVIPPATPMTAESAVPSPRLKLAVGDVLRISIIDRSETPLFGSPANGGVVFPAVRVDETGSISLPYVGSAVVAGQNIANTEEIIASKVTTQAVNLQAHVELVSDPTHAVLVTGEVKNPGHLATLDMPLTVMDAIARAGGPTLPAYSVDVSVRGHDIASHVPYLSILSGSDIPLHDGDQVIVERDDRNFVAIGAVLKPGLQAMMTGNVSLLEGLSAAGGLADHSANPSGVFVFRLREKDGAPSPAVFHLDMSQPVSMFLAQRFALRPDDVVYVTNAPMYELQKIIAPIVQALIIGRSSASLAD